MPIRTSRLDILPGNVGRRCPPVGTLGGYEMTPERDDLTVVEQRIRAAKEYIYKQERLIEWLADEAKNTDDAFALLNILNRALRLFERHQLLLDRLGLSETEKDD
jgi:hypothetical protein